MPNSGYFDVPFASSGDLTVVPDAVQSSGSISYTQGWGPYYSQDPTVDPSTALLIDRAQTNQLFNDVTKALQYAQQHCFPPFITTAMNNGAPFSYSQYDIVLLGGVAYQSLVNANTDTPPSANWAVLPNNLNAFSTGDIKMTLKTAADQGWILMNDQTIGDASSGAGYANANAVNLYTLIWNNVSNTYAPVTGGRGVSAAADFAAHKPMALTKVLGRALAISGLGTGGNATTHALGSTVGDENLQSHNHTLNDPTHTHTINGKDWTSGNLLAGGGGLTENQATADNSSTGITLNTAGTGSSGNMQPSSFFNVMICL